MVDTRTFTYHRQYIIIQFTITNIWNRISLLKAFSRRNLFYLLLFCPILNDYSKFYLLILNLEECTFFSPFKVSFQIILRKSSISLAQLFLYHLILNLHSIIMSLTTE